LIEEADVPAATVEPHCVLVVEMVAPAFCQSTARPGLIIPDHGSCATETPDNESEAKKSRKRYMRDCNREFVIPYHSIHSMSRSLKLTLAENTHNVTS
jgi:hypothetical protein